MVIFTQIHLKLRIVYNEIFENFIYFLGLLGSNEKGLNSRPASSVGRALDS